MASTLNGTGVTFSDSSTQSVGTSGNFKFNSGYGSEAVAYGVRAWVNFDGTGSVASNQTIRGSGNVSSVYKNSTGNYTVNFTSALPDANYAVGAGIATNIGGGTVYGRDSGGSYATTDFSFFTSQNDNSAAGNPSVVNVLVMR